jgi:GxxExxY protein
MHENDITYKIREIVYNIHRKIGLGLLESVYEQIMFQEIIDAGLKVERQVSIPVIWNNKKLEHGFRADLIVENKVIIELKSVEKLTKVHFKQLATYVKLSNLKLGLLINFFEDDINVGIKRYINGTL